MMQMSRSMALAEVLGFNGTMVNTPTIEKRAFRVEEIVYES